ncbi:hypothetical protein MTO96_017308 [Rhipicephalus appendiculatus]
MGAPEPRTHHAATANWWYRKQSQRLMPLPPSTTPTALDGDLHCSGGVQPVHDGQFVCVAANSKGDAKATLTLSVIGQYMSQS